MSETPPSSPSPEPAPGSTPVPPATPAAAPGTPPAGAPGTVNSSSGELVPDPADVEKNKVMAIFAYLGILFLIPLLAAKDSPFAKFHVNQGILLFLGSLVLGIGLAIVQFIVGLVIGGTIACLFNCVLGLVWIAILALAIMGIINVVNGKMKPLPMFPVVNWVK